MPDAIVAVSGVSGTVETGSVTVGGDANVALTGVQGTTALGTLR